MANSPIREAAALELMEIEKLDDETEAEKRYECIEKILSAVYDYEHHVREYEFNKAVNFLRDRGVTFTLVEDVARIKQQWDDLFTSEIAAHTKEEIYYGNFKWHVFSYEKLTAYKKADALIAFLESEKSDVYIFFQFSEECYKIENAHLLEESDMLNPAIRDYISDFYIFDASEKWTYICTHEEECGPYFYKI